MESRRERFLGVRSKAEQGLDGRGHQSDHRTLREHNRRLNVEKSGGRRGQASARARFLEAGSKAEQGLGRLHALPNRNLEGPARLAKAAGEGVREAALLERFRALAEEGGGRRG